MSRDQLPFRLLLLLGIVAAIVLHSAGALNQADAVRAAELPSDVFGGRILTLGAAIVDLVDLRYGRFQSLHLAAALFLAFAAALSGAVAAREADHAPGAGLAAALAIGGAVLFGADLGGAGRSAAPLAVTLLLLAGALACWVREKPLGLTGGVLLGAGVAAHPFALFLVPGILAVGLRRASAGRALAGLALGSLALHLPPPGGSVGGGLGAWWAGGGWTLRTPGEWPAATAALGRTLLANLGYVGLAVAVGGALVGVRDRAFRPWLLPALIPAAALVIGDCADVRTSHALAAWALLFWMIPGIVALARRIPAIVVPGVGFAVAAVLLFANYPVLRDNGEPGSDWALDALRILPDGSLLLSDCPVHRALAGETPEVDVEWVGPASTDDIRAKILGAAERPVYLDASLFFDAARREAVLGQEYRVVPHGVTFRVLAKGAPAPPVNPDVWNASRPDYTSRGSALRDGLTVAEYYGRSMLQSGYLHARDRRFADAEGDFLFALSLRKPNPSLAALGLARVQIQTGNRAQATITLENSLRTEDQGAWTGFELLGDCYRQAQRMPEAVKALERAIRLCPAQLRADRERLAKKLETARAG